MAETGLQDDADGTEWRSETYRTRYDRDRDIPSVSIAEAIAAFVGRDPVEMEPLGNTIDLDALDTILAGRGDDKILAFSLPSHRIRVTIDSGGMIELQQAGSEAQNSEPTE